MRIFKTKLFSKWAKPQNINDDSLKKAIDELCQGNSDGDLGGYVYKKRLAREGQGKSGSYRTIVAFKIDDKAFFVYGFAKSDKASLDAKELKAFKQLAKDLMIMNNNKLELALFNEELIEVISDDNK
ncbi:MAG: type II toxin-antitoxin system RelE/ParE family toxin [Legionella sp.]|nr:type II toxin-antitoxin system RelE/ParE family toxin [Legionella sp.]